jgi:hypothetical protein
MMKRDFDRRMESLSNEALELKAAEAAELAAQTKRDHIKQALMGLVVVALFAVVILKHAEIRDTVAALLQKGPSEREELLALEAESDDAADVNVSTNDARAARKARLREVMRKAKEHASTVDQVMDGTAPAEKK